MHWELTARPRFPSRRTTAADGVGNMPARLSTAAIFFKWKNIDMATRLTFEMLMEAAIQCARGVKWKDSIASWVHPRNIALNCYRLWSELDSGTYRLGGYAVFEVTEPKRRTIRSPRFRDRVVQRAMCNNGLYEDLTRSNIYDNAACQNRKGTSFAMKRLTCHLQRFWRKHSDDGWCLRLDIHKFFDSIPHRQLKEMVEGMVRDEEYRTRVFEIIDSFADPGIGLGSQISQLLAIAYLSRLDHFIKEDLGIEHYVRYSDDIVIVHESKEYLQYAWRRIEEKLKKLAVELNPKSTLHPLRHGIWFLKFRFLLTDSGKVVRLIDQKNVHRMKRRLKKICTKVAAGERSRQDAVNSFTSWKAHANQGNSTNTIRRIKQWLDQSSPQAK